MALTGYFIPYFTDNISFFKIRTLHIEGLETIPPQIVANEIEALRNNWLFIRKDILLDRLNKSTKNAIKDLDIERTFSGSGVDLKIKIKEREPLFQVISGNTKIFYDDEGSQFQSIYINAPIPLIYTHDINFINKNFKNVKELMKLSNIKEVYITELNTIVYLKDNLKLILPPIFLFDKNLLNYLIKLRENYSMGTGVQEMEINRDLVIIRGERE